MSQPACFTCKTEPAGHPDSPNSAYCATCQPKPTDEARASECRCSACGETFTGLTVFDAHQDVNYDREPVIVCLDPAPLGLAQGDRGTWGSAAGLKSRESARTRLAAARSARLAPAK